MNKTEKLKKTRTERPDKAAFSVFTGAFLLIAGICFCVWAYWTFEKYSHASDYAEYLRRNPNALSITKKEQDRIIESNQNSADHDRLEAAWTGVVGLLLLSGAALLFLRAVKIYRRVKLNDYEEIDWRALPKLAQPLEVLYRRTFSVAAILFYVFFGGLTLLVLLSGFRTINLSIGFINLLLLIAVAYLLTKGKRKSVKLFDAGGIKRNDGQYFLWSDFRGVIPRIGVNRYGTRYQWRTELIFTGGREVWVIPQRIKNYDDVYRFVDALPQAVLKETI